MLEDKLKPKYVTTVVICLSLSNTIANWEEGGREDMIKSCVHQETEFKAKTSLHQVVAGSGSRGWNLAGNEKWRAELCWEIGHIILHHLVTN